MAENFEQNGQEIQQTENIKGKKTKEKKGKLFLLIGGILAAVIILFNAAQLVFVTSTTRAELRAGTENEYDEFSRAYSNLVKNVVEKYFTALDFYCNNEYVKEADDTDEIVEWLIENEPNRNKSLFDYVAWVDRDGGFYSDIGTRTNVSARDYYQAIMNGSETFVDNPVTSLVTGISVVHICRAVRVDGDLKGFFCGVVEGDHISSVISDINLGDIGYAALFGDNGELMASSTSDDEVKAMLEYLSSNDEVSYQVFRDSFSLENNIGSIENDKGEKELVFSKSVEKTPWRFILVLDEKQISATATAISYRLLFSGIIISVVIVLLAGFTLYKQIKPLRVVEGTIRGIATGDADLTKRIEVNTNNEIGRVVDGFNQFAGKLHTIILTMKKSKDDLVEVDELLQNSTEDTVAAIAQINGNIQSMDSQVNIQSESVHETAGAVNEIASNIESLNRMIESQSAAVTQASAAVEEMIGNINSVTNSVQKMAGTFKELEEKAVTGIQRNNDVSAKIEEIQAESQALREANVVITSIAEQTNLLAMNAAIEAAHAGEAGKGFSVVADEIRKLSEDSGSQSQTIGDQLDKIIGSIEQMVDASNIASEAFNDVAQQINSTNNLVQEISNAMVEQNEGSNQIAIALHSMNDTSNEVKTASLEMAEGNKAILDEVKHLQDASFSIKDGMNEMASSARKIKETGTALSDLTGRMRTSIAQIGSQVDQFKV